MGILWRGSGIMVYISLDQLLPTSRLMARDTKAFSVSLADVFMALSLLLMK